MSSVRVLRKIIIIALLILLPAMDSALADAEPTAPSTMDEFEFGGTKLYFPNESENLEVRDRVAALAASDRVRPHAIRRWILGATGALLFKFRKPYGVFVSAKGRLNQVAFDKQGLRRWFGRKPVDGPNDQVALDAAVSRASLADEQIAGILGALNSFLLESSAVIATANEQGVMFSVGLQGEVGAAEAGRGGAVSLDLFIGYNRQEETIVISVLPRVESFRGGVTGSVGASVKVEYYWMTNDTELAGGRLNGTAVYPPGLPWGSAVGESSVGGFAAVGIFALIGADFSGGALPLINRTRGVRALRISIPVGRTRVAHGLVEFALSQFLRHIGGDLKSLVQSSHDVGGNGCNRALTGSDPS